MTQRSVSNNGERGFTLIELMIVVVIVGVLAAVGYPSYMSYVKHTHRTAVKGQMMDLAQALERHRSRGFSYEGASVALVPTLQTNQDYNVNLVLDDNKQSFVITATPTDGLMAGDGALKLNSDGDSCYTKGSECTLSEGSHWGS